MKNWFYLFIACASLQAAPVGNGAAPEIIKTGLFTCNDSLNIRAGYEGDFVSDGRMKQKGQGRIDQYQQWTNSGTITGNFFERMDLYALFGSSETKADWRFTDSENVIHRLQLKTDPHLLWGLGGRVILYQWCNLFLGFGGRYETVRGSDIHATNDGINSPVFNFSWKEWQINLDLSYTICYFTPYIGVKHAKAKTTFQDFWGNEEFVNRLPVGVYIGCTLSTGQYMMVNVEGRLTDEEAVTFSADLRF